MWLFSSLDMAGTLRTLVSFFDDLPPNTQAQRALVSDIDTIKTQVRG